MLVAAACGTLAMRVIATAFRHGVIRQHRDPFGRLVHRADEPFDYYYNLALWLFIVVSCYGFVLFQLHWAFVVQG